MTISDIEKKFEERFPPEQIVNGFDASGVDSDTNELIENLKSFLRTSITELLDDMKGKMETNRIKNTGTTDDYEDYFNKALDTCLSILKEADTQP